MAAARHASSPPMVRRLGLGGRPAGGFDGLHLQGVYQFRNRSTWAIEGEATLIAQETGGANGTEHIGVFEFGASANVGKGGAGAGAGAPGAAITMFALLTDSSRMPAVHITNSYFGQNRARGYCILPFLDSFLKNRSGPWMHTLLPLLSTGFSGEYVCLGVVAHWCEIGCMD